MNNQVSVSKSNVKMGAVPSVSLPPIVTCPTGCPCAKKCYAAKLCRLRPNVRESYARNLRIWTDDPAAYELQVKAAASMTRFFRWHVSGDIPNMDYLKMMARIARDLPGTKFLAFTKRYDLVNDFLYCEDKPDNLQLIFSLWDSAWNVRVHNPHDLPLSAVIFKDRTPPVEYSKICGGNCTECAMRGVGCWELKQGETIAFYEH